MFEILKFIARSTLVTALCLPLFSNWASRVGDNVEGEFRKLVPARHSLYIGTILPNLVPKEQASKGFKRTVHAQANASTGTESLSLTIVIIILVPAFLGAFVLRSLFRTKIPSPSDGPFSHYSSDDRLYFKRWLAKNNRTYVRGKLSPHEGLFMCFIYSCTEYCNPNNNVSPDNTYAVSSKINDYSLIEVACYALGSCGLYLQKEHPDRAGEILHYFKVRLTELSSDATGTAPEKLQPIIVNKSVQYLKGSSGELKGLDVLSKFVVHTITNRNLLEVTDLPHSSVKLPIEYVGVVLITPVWASNMLPGLNKSLAIWCGLTSEKKTS